MIRRLAGRLPRPLTHPAPIHHPEPAGVVRRRRVAVAATSVAGAALLGVSLSTRPGSRAFYGSSLGVAAVWTVGGLASGPLHLGWIQSRDDRFFRPVLTPAATGVGAFGLFYGCALVVRRVPLLREAITRVLAFAEQGSPPLVLATALANGVGEEVFFRGALYTALGPRHPVLVSTTVYTAATITTRNPALVLAAGVMGTLFGLQRRATGGLLAPLVTHLTWSTLMVRHLSRAFR
ncbi:MAG TPA: CPBP family intramembrane glutamic endopeptidase [Marmoricola sp.]